MKIFKVIIIFFSVSFMYGESFRDIVNAFDGIHYPDDVSFLDKYWQNFGYYSASDGNYRFEKEQGKDLVFYEKAMLLDCYHCSKQPDVFYLAFPTLLRNFYFLCKQKHDVHLDWWKNLEQMLIRNLSPEQIKKDKEDFEYYKIHGEYPSEGEDY